MIRTVNIATSYKEYYKKEVSNPVSLSIYLKIAGGYLKFLMDKVLEGFRVQIAGGFSMGILYIRGIRPKIKYTKSGNLVGLCVNWVETKKLWKECPELEKKEYVYYTNEHTNGYKYNFVWKQEGMKIGNKTLYSYVAPKPAKRELYRLLTKENREYITY